MWSPHLLSLFPDIFHPMSPPGLHNLLYFGFINIFCLCTLLIDLDFSGVSRRDAQRVQQAGCVHGSVTVIGPYRRLTGGSFLMPENDFCHLFICFLHVAIRWQHFHTSIKTYIHMQSYHRVFETPKKKMVSGRNSSYKKKKINLFCSVLHTDNSFVHRFKKINK